jgi:hypothetical protein
VGTSIIYHLATNGSSVGTSTSDDLQTALAANTLAAALVTVEENGGDTGVGVLVAMAATPLSGGPSIGVVDAIVGSEVDVNIENFARRAA